MQRLKGIDGLKGLSILAILGYHLFQRWLPGGFVGIEVFFTISGFLAAYSLLRKLNAKGSLSFKQYYLGRLRRIVPPLWFMAAFITATAWLIDAKDALVGIGRQLLAVVTFSYNWYDIVRGVDYFSSSGPELFRHLWFISLLIQFYIVIPVIVWFFWKFWKSTRAATAILLLAGVSALLMGLLFTPRADPTRVYFGTDTHLFGLLIGVALAFLLQTRETTESALGTTVTVKSVGKTTETFEAHRVRYSVAALLGGASVVALIYLTIWVIREDATAFRGGLLLVALLTALAIVGSIVPYSWVGRLLEFRPLAALGRHSYGIFLWHWPIATLLLYVFPQWRDPNVLNVGVIALALTALMTWLSHMWIELPVGDKGFFRSLMPTAKGKPREWVSWVAIVLILLFSAVGTVRAIQTAPAKTLTQILLEQNQGEVTEPAAPKPKLDTKDVVKNNPPDPIREMPDGTRLTAVGDSVMLVARPALEAQFPGITVDATVSRAMPAGIGIVGTLQSQRALREYVVVGLATNSMVSTDQLDQLLATMGGGRILVLINAHGVRSWIPPTNDVLRQYVDSHSDNVVLVDWDKAASQNEGMLYSDGIHPTPQEGAGLYATTLYSAINEWVKHH